MIRQAAAAGVPVRVFRSGGGVGWEERRAGARRPATMRALTERAVRERATGGGR